MPHLLASTVLTATIRDNIDRPSRTFWRELAQKARVRKSGTADAGEKNRLWFVGAYAHATELYLDAYRKMGRGEFYPSWCALENAEHAFARLEENPFVSELSVWVRRRADLVALWQSTFPYRHFISPAMIYKRWECSICGKQSTPVDPCGHIPKRVYDGVMCFRRILEAHPREMSIVTDPVQKYSVLQLDYRYDTVQYVLDLLQGPFHPWSGEWTHKRHPHTKFTDHPHDGACPCDSKLRYAECCLPTEGVRMPHFQLEIAWRPGMPSMDEKVLLPRRDSDKGIEDRTVRAVALQGR
jgi:rubredoxin